jgi:hypothetical protein
MSLRTHFRQPILKISNSRAKQTAICFELGFARTTQSNSASLTL